MNNEGFSGAIQILDEIIKIAKSIDIKEYKEVSKLIRESRSIFLTGQGRSGLVAKMFAMRLVHLGFKTYVVGETITPAIQKGDLLIACSGSGETKKVILDSKISKEVGAKVLVFSADISSILATLADYTVIFPGSTNKYSKKSCSIQFGGSLFEQALLIMLDSLIYYLQMSSEIDYREMKKTHTNLE
ncbi:6-phospho-3-hexuloisomerase [bacterium]|nr:6-phospho-3-hexuloisomerase [bacterium]MBU4511189.1 6-phospho-3-hexuloisomerase [bacterium]